MEALGHLTQFEIPVSIEIDRLLWVKDALRNNGVTSGPRFKCGHSGNQSVALVAGDPTDWLSIIIVIQP